MSDEYTELAHQFLREYALQHEYFSSETVCDAYKKAGLPKPPDKGWRDRWGSVMSRGRRSGFIRKVGKAEPSSGSTHMASTALWMSTIYPGERTLRETGASRIEELRKAWVLREITDLRTLLWKCYEFGFDQGVAGKERLQHDKDG